jgi:hypothetical protein
MITGLQRTHLSLTRCQFVSRKEICLASTSGKFQGKQAEAVSYGSVTGTARAVRRVMVVFMVCILLSVEIHWWR